MDNNLPLLMDAISEGFHKALTDPYGDGTFSSADDGMTDCNRFVNYVCEKLGYRKFVRSNGRLPILANDMFAYMTLKIEEWAEVGGRVAQELANAGCLIVAAQEGKPHGHVCIVRPGTLGSSGNWNSTEVPKVANVSRPDLCRIDRGANFAFSKPPRYFALKNQIKIT